MQACSAIAGVIGLAVYAFDTRKIRNATLAQTEASRRPFFAFNTNLDKSRNVLSVTAENVGTGHAMDLHIYNGKGESLQSIELGICIVIHGVLLVMQGDAALITGRLASQDGVRLEYADTAGKRYWSACKPTLDKHGKIVPDHFIDSTGEIF